MTFSIRIAVVVGACLALSEAASAQDDGQMKTDLDAVANPRLFDTLFSRYGFEPLKTLQRKGKWIVVQLPGKIGKKIASQTGLYSYVALAGDFTFEVKYFLGAAPIPKGGYGMSCGIALDTNGPAGMLALARNFSKDKGGSGYAVTRGTPDESGDGKVNYKTQIFPTKAMKGILALRREKDEVVCLAADDLGKMKELCRQKFTDGTVRQIRLYADPGGSTTPMTAWIGFLRVHADEITGGFPKLERRGSPWWPWVLGGLIVVGGAASVFLYQRRRKP